MVQIVNWPVVVDAVMREPACSQVSLISGKWSGNSLQLSVMA